MKRASWYVPIFLLIARTLAVATPQTANEKTEPSSTQTSTIIVRDGTPVQLSTREDLNSKTAKVGQNVELGVMTDVIVNNAVVMPAGSPASGHIVTDKHKKMMGRSGKIEFALDSVKAWNTQIRVRATSAKQGQGKMGTAIALSVIATPAFLLLHGHDAVIPKDTRVTAYVDGDQRVRVSGPEAFTPAPADPYYGGRDPGGRGYEPGPSPQPINSDLPSDVTFKSTPPGGEIMIDGEFIGDTPTTQKVGPGHHEVVVTKPGFPTWQRTLNVSPGAAITLDIVFEKKE